MNNKVLVLIAIVVIAVLGFLVLKGDEATDAPVDTTEGTEVVEETTSDDAGTGKVADEMTEGTTSDDVATDEAIDATSTDMTESTSTDMTEGTSSEEKVVE